MYSGLISSTRSKFNTMLYVRWKALFKGSAEPWKRYKNIFNLKIILIAVYKNTLDKSWCSISSEELLWWIAQFVLNLDYILHKILNNFIMLNM